MYSKWYANWNKSYHSCISHIPPVSMIPPIKSFATFGSEPQTFVSAYCIFSHTQALRKKLSIILWNKSLHLIDCLDCTKSSIPLVKAFDITVTMYITSTGWNISALCSTVFANYKLEMTFSAVCVIIQAHCNIKPWSWFVFPLKTKFFIHSKLADSCLTIWACFDLTTWGLSRWGTLTGRPSCFLM